jgi:dTDP-4-dehydrorhamnose reductase
VKPDILLTGAGGQVGWEIERRAAARDFTVKALQSVELRSERPPRVS